MLKPNLISNWRKYANCYCILPSSLRSYIWLQVKTGSTLQTSEWSKMQSTIDCQSCDGLAGVALERREWGWSLFWCFLTLQAVTETAEILLYVGMEFSRLHWLHSSLIKVNSRPAESNNLDGSRSTKNHDQTPPPLITSQSITAFNGRMSSPQAKYIVLIIVECGSLSNRNFK